MAAYTPHYSTKQQKKGLLRRTLKKLKSRLCRPTKRMKNRTQVAVVGSQRDWRLKQTSKRISFALSLVIVAGLGGWFIFRMLLGSDIFRITSINVEGCRMVGSQQVITMAGLERGMSLLAMDREQVVRRITSQPWIDHAAVKRQWPSGVVLNVREHQPLALVNLVEEGQGRLYYVDRKGKVFSPVEEGQDLDFPVITGEIQHIGLSGERFDEESSVGKAFQFLRLAARGNAILPIQAVSEIHVDKENGLIVYLIDKPFPIYLGSEDVQKKYYRLVKILERLYRKEKVQDIVEIRMNYLKDKVLVASVES